MSQLLSFGAGAFSALVATSRLPLDEAPPCVCPVIERKVTGGLQLSLLLMLIAGSVIATYFLTVALHGFDFPTRLYNDTGEAFFTLLNGSWKALKQITGQSQQAATNIIHWLGARASDVKVATANLTGNTYRIAFTIIHSSLLRVETVGRTIIAAVKQVLLHPLANAVRTTDRYLHVTESIAAFSVALNTAFARVFTQPFVYSVRTLLEKVLECLPEKAEAKHAASDTVLEDAELKARADTVDLMAALMTGPRFMKNEDWELVDDSQEVGSGQA